MSKNISSGTTLKHTSASAIATNHSASGRYASICIASEEKGFWWDLRFLVWNVGVSKGFILFLPCLTTRVCE